MIAILSETGLVGAIGGGLVFAEAGLAKLRHRAIVRGVIANYRILPDILIAPVAVTLPWIELSLGLGLIVSGIVGGALSWLALPAAALLIGFALAMAINIRRGRSHVDCGCGRSQLRQTLHPALVLRNLVLAGLIALHVTTPGPADAIAVILALVAGACLFGLFALFNALCALALGPLTPARLTPANSRYHHHAGRS